MASLATQNHTASATSSGVISRLTGCLVSSAAGACPVVRPDFSTTLRDERLLTIAECAAFAERIAVRKAARH
jgi:hypothetical protein